MILDDKKLWGSVDNILDNLNESHNKCQTLHDMLKTIVETAERRGAREFIRVEIDGLNMPLTGEEFTIQMIEELLNPSSPERRENTTSEERLHQACNFLRAAVKVLKNAK